MIDRIRSIEKDKETLSDIEPFRTASIMVNRECNLTCRHCDIPARYTSEGAMLSPAQWDLVIRELDRVLNVELVAVSAREPLMPGITREKTLKVVKTAQSLGKIAGIVTNGSFLKDALREFADPGLVLDYLDVSLEGSKEIDDRIRGNGHFEKVMSAINDVLLMKITKKFFISLTLSTNNCKNYTLQDFIEWMFKTFDEPRLAVLVLYPNVHVPENLWLTDQQFLRSLELLLGASEKFADIFIDVFPGSIPNLHEIVERGYLPGDDELLRDRTGMLWGYVGENLYVRYENIRDLMRYQVRITPEGGLIMPRDLEVEDYGSHIRSKVLSEGFEDSLNQVLEDVDLYGREVDPRCTGKSCFLSCRGDNFRCSFPRRE